MAEETTNKGFLEELEALEKFRISYTAQYPSVPLAHDDPDIRRLIEAMAFFTARTRKAAMRSLDESIQRIFRQQFPSLLGPVPAMGMLKAVPGGTFTDATQIPKGTEVLLRKQAVDDEPERLFRFRTLADLQILPIRVKSVDIVTLRGERRRILIRIVANTAHNQELRELRLHINHLDDLRSSMTVVHELSTHLRSASVVYEPNAREDAEGQPVHVSFGPVDDPAAIPGAFEDPLQKARLVARFPRQDLYMNIRGLRPPRNWQYITICLDVGEEWPKRLRMTSEGIEPCTVPMINVQRSMANPIDCDGMRDRYPLRHPDESGKFAPLWVIGAYRPTKEGFVPLESGAVGTEHDSYEILTDGEAENRRAWAMFKIPSAYDKPERISVEAFWHQPGLRGVSTIDLSVGLADRFVEGVTWSCSGPIVPYVDSTMDGDRDAQIELVSLKTLRFLGHAELTRLLHACGAHREAHFAKIAGALEDVSVVSKPYGKRAQGIKYIYELTFGPLDASEMPRMGMFCDWLLDVLSVWSAEEVLEVVAHIPNLDRTVHRVG